MWWLDFDFPDPPSRSQFSTELLKILPPVIDSRGIATYDASSCFVKQKY